MTQSTETSPAGISDGILDQIETLLDLSEFVELPRLDELQGHLCGSLAGPDPLSTEEWIAIVSEEIPAEHPEAAQLIKLLTQFAENQQQQLGSNADLTLYLYPKDESPDSASDYEPWCAAYLAAVDSAPADWFEAGLSEEESDWLDEHLFPMMVLTGEAQAAAAEHDEGWPEGEERETLEADCEGSVIIAVTEIHRFWQAKQGVATLRRDTPKVGRNDPCPCGSGHKYKQCCGKEA